MRGFAGLRGKDATGPRPSRGRGVCGCARRRSLPRHEDEPVGREHDPARERTYDDLDPAARLVEPRRVERAEAGLALDALVAQERGDPLRLRLRARRDEDSKPATLPVSDPPNERRQRRVLPPGRPRRLHGARQVFVVAGRDVERLRRRLERADAFARRARDGGAVQRDQRVGLELADDLALVSVEGPGQEAGPALLVGVARRALEVLAQSSRQARRISRTTTASRET